MNTVNGPGPRPGRRLGEMRVGLVAAALMLVVPVAAKVAARQAGWNAIEFSQRALMTIVAGFIVFTGNAIPKRIGALACRDLDAARSQAFHRFAGWTWVLTGLALGLAWLLLPFAAAGTATYLVVPAGIALVTVRWLALRAERPPAA